MYLGVSGVDVVETRENAQWWDTKDRVKVRTVGEILEKDGRAVAYMYRDATTHDRGTRQVSRLSNQ